MPTAELLPDCKAFPARQPLATGNSDSLQYDFRFHRYGFRCGYSSSFPSLHTLCKQLLYTGHRYTGWVNTAPAVPDLQKFLLPHSKVSSAVRRRQCHNPVSAAVWVKIAAKSLATGNPLRSNQTLSVFLHDAADGTGYANRSSNSIHINHFITSAVILSGCASSLSAQNTACHPWHGHIL